MSILIFLIFLANFFAAHGISRDYDFTSHDYFKRQEGSQCKQEIPNCGKCLQNRSCRWCSSDSQGVSSDCKSTYNCPSSLQLSCPENTLEDQIRSLYEDRSYTLDVPQVTLNASYLCHLKTNCSTCTGLEFCAWCKTKKACVAYSGASTTKSCGSESWFKNQCVYSGFTKPCPSRKSNCKECLFDGICYWCESTKQCAYYPGPNGFQSINCSTDQRYYQSCSHVREILVLLPIILFILTPVIAYLVLYGILCLMRREGYDGLEDSDSDDEDQKRRPIMLRHSSPGGKTDKLRKKYDLNGNP